MDIHHNPNQYNMLYNNLNWVEEYIRGMQLTKISMDKKGNNNQNKTGMNLGEY